jgi:hypothetical protein
MISANMCLSGHTESAKSNGYVPSVLNPARSRSPFLPYNASRNRYWKIANRIIARGKKRGEEEQVMVRLSAIQCGQGSE